MKNYLYQELLEACAIIGTNPTAWAANNGLSTGTPTQLKNGVRPTIQTLERLVNSWEDKQLGLELAVAYLKDEIARMGISLDCIEPIIKSSQPARDLDEDLNVIFDCMKHKPVRESIHEFAALLRVSEWNRKPQEIIAQGELDAAIHKTKRKTKNRVINRGTA